ncbi:hypothetical protein D3C77_668170 [compost metagenome]
MIVTWVGIALRMPSVMNSVQETTADRLGSTLRATMVCKASTISAPITIGSIPMCGRAAWVPLPWM